MTEQNESDSHYELGALQPVGDMSADSLIDPANNYGNVNQQVELKTAGANSPNIKTPLITSKNATEQNILIKSNVMVSQTSDYTQINNHIYTSEKKKGQLDQPYLGVRKQSTGPNEEYHISSQSDSPNNANNPFIDLGSKSHIQESGRKVKNSSMNQTPLDHPSMQQTRVYKKNANGDLQQETKDYMLYASDAENVGGSVLSVINTSEYRSGYEGADSHYNKQSFKDNEILHGSTIILKEQPQSIRASQTRFYNKPRGPLEQQTSISLETDSAFQTQNSVDHNSNVLQQSTHRASVAVHPEAQKQKIQPVQKKRAYEPIQFKRIVKPPVAALMDQQVKRYKMNHAKNEFQRPNSKGKLPASQFGIMNVVANMKAEMLKEEIADELHAQFAPITVSKKKSTTSNFIQQTGSNIVQNPVRSQSIDDPLNSHDSYMSTKIEEISRESQRSKRQNQTTKHNPQSVYGLQDSLMESVIQPGSGTLQHLFSVDDSNTPVDHNYSNSLLYNQAYKNLKISQLKDNLQKKSTPAVSRSQSDFRNPSQSLDNFIDSIYQNKDEMTGLPKIKKGLRKDGSNPNRFKFWGEKDPIQRDLRQLMWDLVDENQNKDYLHKLSGDNCQTQSTLEPQHNQSQGSSTFLPQPNNPIKQLQIKANSNVRIPRKRRLKEKTLPLVHEQAQFYRHLSELYSYFLNLAEFQSVEQKVEILADFEVYIDCVKSHHKHNAFEKLQENMKKIIRILLQPEVIKLPVLGLLKSTLLRVAIDKVEIQDQIMIPMTQFPQYEEEQPLEEPQFHKPFLSKTRKPSSNAQLFDVLYQCGLQRQLPDTFELTQLESKNLARMFDAVTAKDIQTVQKLAIDEPNLVSEVNSKLETPLHIAVRQKDKDMIKFLCEFYASVHAKDIHNESPMDIVDKNRWFDIEVILDKYK